MEKKTINNPPAYFSKGFFADRSLNSLLFVNLAVIILSVIFQWNIFIILWSYWLQSVVIGIFHFFRILELKEFSAKGLKINGASAERMAREHPQKLKRQIAFFFCVHYGLFHLVYAGFLFIMPFMGDDNAESFIQLSLNFRNILLNGLLFALHYGISYYYYKDDLLQKPNIGTMMFEPYPRIIPMHLIIIIYFFCILKFKIAPKMLTQGALVLFMSMKTLVEAVMYVVYRKRMMKKLSAGK